jgi:hypothetical protein
VTALLNGVPCPWLRLTVGWSGRILVEAEGAEDILAPGGLVTAIVGDLSVVATLVPGRFGMFAGSWSGQAIGGRGGWGKSGPAKGYTSPVGVLNTQVIQDAAREAGELPPVVQVPHVIGQFYERRGELPLSQVLNQRAAGTDWWVDELGITQVGYRLPSIVVAPFELDYQPQRGRAIVSTDNPAAFRPGAVFTDLFVGPLTVNSVVWTSTPNSLRGSIWIG